MNAKLNGSIVNRFYFIEILLEQDSFYLVLKQKKNMYHVNISGESITQSGHHHWEGPVLARGFLSSDNEGTQCTGRQQ